MKTYPLFKVHTNPDSAVEQIRKVLESGFINEGVQVTQLTDKLKVTLNANNLILTNSCTSALTMALKLAGVKNTIDEVISTPMTCVATNTPIVNLGAKIVWADIDPRNGMLDPTDVVKKITPKTKAVMAVAWAGTPPELEALHMICQSRCVPLILDAAHAFDAFYKGMPVHAWADYTCYSFQAIKHFTTGDGGALICKDFDDYKRSKTIKWFGIDRDAAKDEKGDWKGQQWDVDIREAGYKFNMNNISAAIGLSNLPYIQHVLGRHKVNARLYRELFSSCRALELCEEPEGSDSSSWVFTLKVNKDYCGISRDDLLKTLNAEGIMAGVVHVPNDVYTCFKEFESDLPGVRDFGSRQFSLPCGWWISEDDVYHIVKRVKEITR